MRYNIILFWALSVYGTGQTIQLNEVVSSNASILYDEDGDTPDWIELYNNSNTSINLEGYGITDDPEDLTQWTFPDLQIEPEDFLILFASDKDRKDIVAQWNGVIFWGDLWSYWLGSTPPISNWNNPESDISDWPTGQSGFGYGDNDDNTETSQIVSIFVRKTFEIEDPSIIIKALFHIDYDDGYVAYLNGEEFSRKNLGAPNSEVSYDQTTTGLHEAEIYQGGFPEEISIDLSQFPIVEGENTLAIEVHNYSNTSSDLSCIPFLTLGYNTQIENILEPHSLMALPESYLHTNFKLSSSGESLTLSDSESIILDSIFTGELETDMSFGRYLEGSDWVLFYQPTPETSNSTDTYSGALSIPQFSLNSGFYDQNQVSVELSSLEDSATIYFTNDGTNPTPEDLLYEYPIPITETTVLRARVFLDGWLPSDTQSKTYLMDEELPDDLPAIFVTTNPNNFFDNDTGIYAEGSDASSDFPYFGANFWEDWETTAHFEILESNGSGFSADAGVKIFGGWSRGFPQKSLAFYSRSYYGPSVFNYNLFPNSHINNYEAFVLRNSGNDWESTMLRDGFITSLTNGIDIDHQQYRPAVLYINGDFWGIQNIREKVNEHFIASHHSIGSEHIDLLDIQGVNEENIVHGTNTDYINLIDYLENADLTEPDVQIALENWIDIESYMSYQAFQIFIDNQDWPGNNIKFWRDHRVGGKWRWILYDTDFGFSIWNYNAYTNNTLSFALNPNGPGWPNPPWSTFLFRKLTENEHFKDTFINIYCDLLNTIFTPEYLTTHLDSIASQIQSIIPRHRERWYNNGNWPNSALNWETKINVMENFSNNRQAFARNHLKNEFDLPNIAQMTVNISPQTTGSITINSLNNLASGWNGYYFPTVPVEVKAVANDGYQFSHWLEFPDSSEILHVEITDPFVLTAIFISSELGEGISVINEINYNSNDNSNSGDWIELVNIGETDLDISNWILKDDDDSHSFSIPEETILETNSYIVLAEDLENFNTLFPEVNNVIGSFDFGLSGGGDQVRLFNDVGILMDSLEYDDGDPWPTEPDGNGPTLELINPYLNNSLAVSWASSQDIGSPGTVNTSYLSTDVLENILPQKTNLLPAYPNPFNGAVTIPLQLAKPINTSISIYSLLGKHINDIPIGHLGAGKHKIIWHGENKIGNSSSTGIYFVILEMENSKSVQKLIYLK